MRYSNAFGVVTRAEPEREAFVSPRSVRAHDLQRFAGSGYALSRAARPQYTVVTDNSKLSEIAKGYGASAQGFNWFLDQMGHSGKVAA